MTKAAATPQLDEQWMARAIRLASGIQTHPNPRVGAVIVDPSGEVVGEGAHQGAGTEHAEVLALAAAGAAAAGSTVYVSLEPCSHHGRTPPCADALVAARVARVVVGATDPDERVAGRGIERLRAAGIEVEVGVLEERAEGLDAGYFHHRRTGRPRVTLKSALTLDGQIAARDGTSQWISSEEARADGHRLRAESDAVMVGAGTVLADDPRLTVRLEGWRGRQPVPVIVAGARPLPPDLGLLKRGAWVAAGAGVETPGERIVAGEGARVDLAACLDELGRRDIVDLLVEGGAGLAGSLLRAGLVDRGVFYIAAKLGAGQGHPAVDGVFETLSAAREIRFVDVRRVGPDLRVEFVEAGG